MWVCKLPIPVDVTFARDAGITDTLEGPVHHEAGDALMTGIRGEHWPIRKSVFLDTYKPVSPTRAGEPGLYVKRPTEVLALELCLPISVGVSWQGDLLTGQAGDWLIQYGPGDYGIVTRTIFEQTYQQVR